MYYRHNLKICAVIFAASLLPACGPGTENKLDSGGVSFVSAMSNGVGLRDFDMGFPAITAYGVVITPDFPARGHLISVTANADGSYAQVDAYREWVSGAWTNPTLSSAAPSVTGDFVLDAVGNWVAFQTAPANTLTFRQNTNGTISVNDPLYGDNISYLPVTVNLGGNEILSGALYPLGDSTIPAASGVVTVGQMDNITGNGNPAFLGHISPFAKYSASSAVWFLTGGITTREAYRGKWKQHRQHTSRPACNNNAISNH